MHKLTIEEKRELKKELIVPVIATLLAIVLLLVSNILPLLTVKTEYKEFLLENPTGKDAFGELLTNEQAVDISTIEYYKLHCDAYPKEEVIAFTVFFGAAILAFVALLFAIFRKPIAVIIVDLLAIIPYVCSISYISEKKVLETYDWGFAKFWYVLGFLCVALCAIWMLRKKCKYKYMCKMSSIEIVDDLILDD